MRVAFSTDDHNECAREVLSYLESVAEVAELATGGIWPEVGRAVGEAVASGRADLGVVMCWTGTGTSMAANKVAGVRAALAWEPWIATGARRWNDANVLALSTRRLAPAVAVECARAFIEATEVDRDELPAIEQLKGYESLSRPTGGAAPPPPPWSGARP